MNLVEDNLGLVANTAKRYQNMGLEFQDCFQEGVIGLMEAVKRFEPERGYKFSSYATYWIKSEIVKALDNSHTIRKPAYINTELKRLSKATRDLNQEDGVEPSVEKLAKRLKMTIQKVRHLQKISQPVSGIDNLVVKDEADPIKELDNKLLGELLQEGINKLSPRNQKIADLRFKQEMTYEEIAEELGVTPQRVHSLVKNLYFKLRTNQLKAYL